MGGWLQTMNQRRLVFRLCLLPFWLLGACAGQVTIAPHYPQPVVTPLPVQVGVFYSPEFTDWVYSDDDSGVEFELGSKQVALFQSVFKSQFKQVVALAAIGTDGSGPQWQIKPVTTEFAFLKPKETDTAFYAVSIKYRLEIYSPGGEHVADWPLIAYGRSRGAAVQWKDSLGEATTAALRDAAAALVSGFGTWVAQHPWNTKESGG